MGGWERGGAGGEGEGEGDLHRHIQFGMLAPGEAVSGDLVRVWDGCVQVTSSDSLSAFRAVRTMQQAPVLERVG